MTHRPDMSVFPFIRPCNTTTEYGKDFYVSYNPSVANYGHPTTALVIGPGMQYFYILNGDHRKQYANIHPPTVEAFIDYFKAHNHLIAKYSDIPPTTNLREPL